MSQRQQDETDEVAASTEGLRAAMQGPVLLPGNDGYDEVRHVWNGMIDRRPAVIARCTGTADVLAAVAFAHQSGLPVSVRGGGHNVAGNAVCDDGLMIDLSLMRGIHVDPRSRTARAQPGLTWGEFDRETQVFGMATTGGLVSTTGIAGFTLGGGLGWLMRSRGLACDNLLSVDIVTPDGRCLTASAGENADLYWGVRGGGGNFGVVTSFEFQLYPLTTVLAGLVVHPWTAARDALLHYGQFVESAPDELTAHALLFSTPEGEHAVAYVVCYSGDLNEGESVLRPLRAWGSPTADTIGPLQYTTFQSMFDAANPPGRRYYWKSNMLRSLEGAIDAMLDVFPSLPSASSSILIENIGGAVARVPEDATAYPHRGAAFDFLAASVWDDPGEDEANISWARDVSAALEPHAHQSVYVNYLGDEGDDRVRQAYGPDKYERLVALKNEYDPTNLLHMNQNIRPRGDSAETRSADEIAPPM